MKTHTRFCAAFVLACAALATVLAVSIATSPAAAAPAEPVRLGTPTIELPELRITAEPLTDAAWEDLSDSGRTPAPCSVDCPALAPKAVRKPAAKIAPKPAACRVHVLEQGGSPTARTVLACG